jgi:hypothetical protein
VARGRAGGWLQHRPHRAARRRSQTAAVASGAATGDRIGVTFLMSTLRRPPAGQPEPRDGARGRGRPAGGAGASRLQHDRLTGPQPGEDAEPPRIVENTPGLRAGG